MSNFTIKDLLQDRPKQELTILKSSATFYVALWTFYKKGLSASPVHDGEKYVGSISNLDLVTYACLQFEDKRLISLSQDEFWEKESSIIEDEAAVISNLSTRNPFVTVKTSLKIEKLMYMFSETKGLLRVWVEDESDDKELIACVTQSDVCRFLVRHFANFKDSLAGKVVGEWAKKDLITVQRTGIGFGVVCLNILLFDLSLSTQNKQPKRLND